MKNKVGQHFTEKHLLEEGFAKPIVLVTYSGNVLIKEKIKVLKYDHKIDKQEATPKLNVLFAFPLGDFDTVKTDIKLNKKIEDQHLKPIEKPKDRPVVATQEEYQAGQNQHVQITMRTGHMLSGYQTHATQYNLIVQINDVYVLVYKHGILEYEITEEETAQSN